MTRFHYPISIPEHYSADQVLAILELLEVLHDAIRDVYALQLHELDRAERERFTDDGSNTGLNADPDIEF